MKLFFIFTILLFSCNVSSQTTKDNNYISECESHLKDKMNLKQKNKYFYKNAWLGVFENSEFIIVMLESVSNYKVDGSSYDDSTWSTCHIARSSMEVKFSSLDIGKFYMQKKNSTDADQWFLKKVEEGQTIGVYDLEFTRKGSHWFLVSTRFDKIKK